jgi:protein-disulfide isomerase
MNRLAVAAVLALSLTGASVAQRALGASPNTPATTFKDTSMLKPPAGQKVAIIEWEDLECPACAHAFPLVHSAVKQYNIPLVRYDFPLQMHVWSHDAAIIARYIQD